MNRFTVLATALALSWMAGFWLATALQAATSNTLGVKALNTLNASMPIEMILIVQDAEAVKREHARLGVR